MINVSGYKRMKYNEALISKEARNCGLYLVYQCDEILYVGKASSITLKRRISEHLTYDNAFNTLTRKASVYNQIPLNNTEAIFSYIIDELEFVLIPFVVHGYKQNGDYGFCVETSARIKEEERKLIKHYDPPLNKRKIIPRSKT